MSKKKELEKRIADLVAYRRGIDQGKIIPADWHITPNQPDRLEQFNAFCHTNWTIQEGKIILE